MDPLFNNREIAVAIWSSLFILWACRLPNVQKLIKLLFLALTCRPVLVIFSLMAVYIFLVTQLLSHLELWNMTQLKNTILWFFLFASVELFKADSIKTGDRYFATSLKQHISLLVVFQFVVALNSFSLIIELIIVPVSVLFTLLLAFSETKEEYKPVERLMSTGMSILGFVLIAGGVFYIYNNYEKIAQTTTLLDFTVPILLSLFLLPFVYLISLYMRYETSLTVINLYTDNPIFRRYAKLKGVLHFKWDHKKLRDWVLHSCSSDYESYSTIDQSIRNYKASENSA